MRTGCRKTGKDLAPPEKTPLLNFQIRRSITLNALEIHKRTGKTCPANRERRPGNQFPKFRRRAASESKNQRSAR